MKKRVMSWLTSHAFRFIDYILVPAALFIYTGPLGLELLVGHRPEPGPGLPDLIPVSYTQMTLPTICSV